MYDAEHSSTTRVTTADRGRSKSSPEEGNSKHTDLSSGETRSFIPAPCGISSVCFLRGIWSSAHFSKNLSRKDITCDSTQVWVLNKKDSHQIRFTIFFLSIIFQLAGGFRAQWLESVLGAARQPALEKPSVSVGSSF